MLRRESVEICLDEHRERIGPVRNHPHSQIRNERRYAEHSATYGLMVRSIAGMSVMISITTMRDAAGGAVIRLVIRMDPDSGLRMDLERRQRRLEGQQTKPKQKPREKRRYAQQLLW